jgi:hypothetical protein
MQAKLFFQADQGMQQLKFDRNYQRSAGCRRTDFKKAVQHS